MCINIFDKIKLVIYELFENVGIKSEDIDFVILIGGATRKLGIKNLLKSIF